VGEGNEMIPKNKQDELRSMIYKALDDVTSEDVMSDLINMEWTDNVISLMTDAAVSVLLAAEETFQAREAA
jgi:hypothetical protein